MELQTSIDFDSVFDSYPDHIKPRMRQLRGLVHDVVADLLYDGVVQETLKWGEPSFVTKHGSTLRMDWKPKAPNQCALYFKCTSLLVATFKDVYGDKLKYEGSRAIVLPLTGDIPEAILRECISAALRYHKINKIPLLGLA